MDSETLKKFMQLHGLGAPRVAALLSVTKQAVYLWLNGKRRMPTGVGDHLRLIVEKKASEKEQLLRLMGR